MVLRAWIAGAAKFIERCAAYFERAEGQTPYQRIGAVLDPEFLIQGQTSLPGNRRCSAWRAFRFTHSAGDKR